jgi:LPS sulfotransferase NodH
MIPANNFADVGFEELQKDPRNTVSDIYDQLEINFPAETKEKIGSYLDQVKNYKQNVYEELTNIEKSRIYAEWKICFDHWNYPIT